MAPWFLCHLQLGWQEGWELVGLNTLSNTRTVLLLLQARGRRQPQGGEGG